MVGIVTDDTLILQLYFHKFDLSTDRAGQHDHEDDIAHRIC